jgi:8-oxo-dGTP pyrophosphatase MutT (NUDIX family)
MLDARYRRGSEIASPMTAKPDWMTAEGEGWRRLGQPRVMYDNPWMQVTEQEAVAPTGHGANYGVVHFKNFGIAILPIHADGTVTLVGQHRYVAGEYSWELPEGGGALDVDPLDSAKRELAEETGLVASDWRSVLSFELSNSITDERGFGFIATGLSQGDVAPDETEIIRVARVPFLEALEQATNGNIVDMMTVAVLLRAYHMAMTGGLPRALTQAMLQQQP